MRDTFREMEFSKEGITPKGFTMHINYHGFLFRLSNATGEYKPVNPRLGNARVIGSRGAYFYFMACGKQLRINQDDIMERGTTARPIDVATKKEI